MSVENIFTLGSICFACHYCEFNRWKQSVENIKIADISIILERSQKCVIDNIVVKIKTGEILAQILSYFNILIFCPPIVAFLWLN
jgi:hypothetical protein